MSAVEHFTHSHCAAAAADDRTTRWEQPALDPAVEVVRCPNCGSCIEVRVACDEARAEAEEEDARSADPIEWAL